MRRIIYFILCFFILTISTFAFSAEIKEEISEINLDSTNLEFNLGNVNKSDIVYTTIQIRNKLDEPLQIIEARSSCECIEIYTSPQIVDKDGIFEVEIAFDTEGVSGDVEEVLYIVTENIKYELIRLVVLATIVEAQ